MALLAGKQGVPFLLVSAGENISAGEVQVGIFTGDIGRAPKFYSVGWGNTDTRLVILIL
jgi:hypothetical protein